MNLNGRYYDEKIINALKIWSKCLPSKTDSVIKELCNIYSKSSREILQRVETPLKLILDLETNMYYLGCNSNRIENYFRSPYTNKFYLDPNSEEEYDSEKAKSFKEIANSDLSHLKMLETEFQKAYESYCQNYTYMNSGLEDDISDHGVLLSNVYCYDIEGDSFGTCFVMKHLINPFNFSTDDSSNEKFNYDYTEMVYFLDIIHNVETVLSHSSGISTYKVGSTYYFGFKNKQNESLASESEENNNGEQILFDGCKTNWIEKKFEFNTTKFLKGFLRSNTKSNISSETNNENNLQNVAIDRNSITIINNQTIYYHISNIGKLIESIDNNVMRQIQHVMIDNLSNISNNLHD
ncbi:F-actin capping beta subunit [Cryptosporidium ubiquitum]|uniref:F-actin-capping protein subunit beta n=1 Tax=Cryptosporidium ubiquitum TaxID=857276 RepID=A0A1J4MMW5_9CRYT|nr:F-actin capping beta subunit [Cryptosporidium ubiquitum]OII74787.1 F-actin capping beta subunit [Cryptosporidium ubiquitum]